MRSFTSTLKPVYYQSQMEYDIDASALSNSISQTVPLNKNQLGTIGFQNWDALNKCGPDIIKEN